MSYVIKDSVPILDEHTLFDDEGQAVVTIDAAKLEQIAAKNNKRVRDTGDLVPIIIGHTKDDAPEDRQPQIVGYADHFRVLPFFKTGKKAIHARFRFFKNLVGRVAKFPRRSVELWLSDWKIDPIALLGATAPDRDLGLLKLAADGSKLLVRTLKQPESDMDPKEIIGQVVAALQQSAVWKWAEAQMKKGEAQEPGLEEEPLPGEGDMGEGGEEPYPGEGEGEEGPPPDEEKEDGEEPVRYNGGACAPSGSNTFTPGDRKRMQKDQARGRLARLQRSHDSMSRQVQDLRVKYQRSEREKDLIQLEAEGYDFDRVEELDLVSDMADGRYRKHLAVIRKRYKRAPVGRGDFTSAPVSAGTQGRLAGRNRDHAMQIAGYAAEKGISYEQAADALEGEPTF